MNVIYKFCVIACAIVTTSYANATEYKTIVAIGSYVSNSYDVQPTDVVTILARSEGSTSYPISTTLTLQDNTVITIDSNERILNPTFTGIKRITVTNSGGSRGYCTVKVTPAENTTPTQPTNVAVIPSDANGQYQVILESSIDMVTWNPVNPGNYGGNTPSRFFRTRIVKLP